MAKLNPTARATLREAGISQAAWARANWSPDGKWSGDQCGCPDNRCANGFHHMGADDCGCLPTLIGLYFEWLGGADAGMFDQTAYEYVNRVVVEDRRAPAPSGPSPDEREAFAAILRGYAGLFVAVAGSDVIASGTDLGDLLRVLRDKGLRADSVFRVPGNPDDTYCDHPGRKPQEG